MDINKKEYKSIVDIKEYERKGIYHSELYLFWTLARERNVNRIVESGTYRGFTANRLEKLFPDCDIYTYEFREERWRDAKKLCHPRINVMLGKLDMSVLTKNSAVLIDGPKNMTAIDLAASIVDKVALVAIHDMSHYVPVLKERFANLIHSGTPIEDIAALDKKIPSEVRNRHRKQNGNKYHGPVLACVWKNE